MGEKIRTGHGGGQVGRVRQGRHLVAHVGAGNDDAGRERGGNAQAGADAHEGDADGARRAPGRPRRQADDGADEKSGEKEEAGREDFQAVVDHAGDAPAEDPGTDDEADGHEDDDGLKGHGDAGDHPVLDLAPADFEHPTTDEGRENSGEYDGDMSIDAEHEHTVTDHGGRCDKNQ